MATANHTDASVDNPAVPLLKWPGGKRWIAGVLSQVLRHELRGIYYEPFVGGAAVFLALRPSRAVLSDVNADLMSFYRTVGERGRDVAEAVWRFSNTRACYDRVRRMRPRGNVTQAARFLYLSRTCWGGIYRLNRKGVFNVPFGDSGRQICRREMVLGLSSALVGATLEVADFSEPMARASAGDVIYADPPYTTLGQHNGFVRYNERLFAWNDQQRLAIVAQAAAERGAFVAVSGLWHRDVLSLYRGWWALEAGRRSLVSCDVSGRRHIKEVILFSRRPSLAGMVARHLRA